jgi:hypothetical protein
MSHPTENKKPQVNPILEGLTSLIMIASVITILITLVLSWTSEKQMESTENFGVMTLAIIAGIAAFVFNKKLTSKRDEWEYKQSIEIKEEKEMRIDDRFFFTRIYKNTDNPSTYLYNYIVSNGTLYQVHPYEDEKFSADYLGVGSVIYAKIIEEDDQLKIIEYTILSRVAPTQYPNNEYQATGTITEKYVGYSPYGLKNQTTADFPRIIADPRLKQNIAKSFQLKLDGAVLQSIKEGRTDKFFLRINRHFEQVSMQDFLNFKTGDIVTFTRNEKTGISSITT